MTLLKHREEHFGFLGRGCKVIFSHKFVINEMVLILSLFLSHPKTKRKKNVISFELNNQNKNKNIRHHENIKNYHKKCDNLNDK